MAKNLPPPPQLTQKYQSVGDIVAAFGEPAAWIAAETHTSREFAAARDLIALGIDYNLPQIAVRRTRMIGRDQGQKYTVMEPMFPGYIFIATDSLWLIREQDWVKKWISIAMQDQFRADLLRIESALRVDPSLSEDRDRKLTSGIWKVLCGPMRGLSGKVVSLRKGRATLIPEADGDVSGYAAVEVDVAALESA